MILNNPAVAYRDCQHCLKYVYNEDTGQVEIGRDGEPEERFFACPPPCKTDRGCPKGTPENTKSLWPQNQLCYEHYQECKAVGEFPDDGIVRRNAAIIRSVEELAKENREHEFKAMLMAMAVRG